MPSKTEKQKKFFGAVMGAKKGEKNVSGKAKKVAKEMPKKEIKKFLKTEEDEESTMKKMEKNGGSVKIKGPKVKERKKFAPPTKVETPKKGKGSYNRKKASEEDEEAKSCWKGYKKKGMKKKGRRMVPNCVKESYDDSKNISKFIEAVLSKKYAEADQLLNQCVEFRLAKKIESELNKPLF